MPETKHVRAGRFQYTLTTLLAAMAWVALVCLALRTPTGLWSAAIGLLTLIAILSSVLVAINRSGQARAAALGFAVFAGGYLGTDSLKTCVDGLVGPSLANAHLADRVDHLAVLEQQGVADRGHAADRADDQHRAEQDPLQRQAAPAAATAQSFIRG